MARAEAHRDSNAPEQSWWVRKWIQALEALGQSILAEKYRFKIREGFLWENLHLPGRIFETPSPVPGMSKSFLRKGLAHARKKLEKALEEIGGPIPRDS